MLNNEKLLQIISDMTNSLLNSLPDKYAIDNDYSEIMDKVEFLYSLERYSNTIEELNDRKEILKTQCSSDYLSYNNYTSIRDMIDIIDEILAIYNS